MFSQKANAIFQDVIKTYKVLNTVDQPFTNKYNENDDLIAHLLYRKSWIDTVQWAYEDIIRDPNIDPVAALKLKRMIDASNQDRTDASDAHKAACQTKLNVLLDQRMDLSTAIDDLLNDISNGDKYMKVYKQMKMYNDDELNPVLRGQK